MERCTWFWLLLSLASVAYSQAPENTTDMTDNGNYTATVFTAFSSPCNDPEFRDTEICQAKARNSDCTGSDCWSCGGGLTSTKCVTSSWVGWKADYDKFAHECSGELVRWGHDSGVQDCGVPCVFCSKIRACCDPCTTILKVSGRWKRIQCLDVETEVTFSYGVEKSDSSSWSRTETWSNSVSSSASASGSVEAVSGEIKLTAESSHSLEQQISSSWSVTTSENTVIKFTQPAQTCSWKWTTVVTDSCGVREADSQDFVLTRGDSRGNSPCCLPGLTPDENGNCPPDSAGNVINLCSPPTLQLPVLGSAADPCQDPEFSNSDVCRAKSKNSDCTGSNCWSCDGPLTQTKCVESDWISWKSHEDQFQNVCPGQLVRWGHDSGVQDCGVACLFCSYIRACCDDCTTVLKVTGEWKRISCLDVETQVSFTYGVTSNQESKWSRTEKWSNSVSATASAEGTVDGVTGKLTLEAKSAHALTETTSNSWSITTTETTKTTFTQPAETCSWHWRSTITDSCGVRTADTRDFIITSGPDRGNAPCCLPGLTPDSDGNCPPDSAGNVYNLCKPQGGNTLMTRLGGGSYPTDLPTEVQLTNDGVQPKSPGVGWESTHHAPININVEAPNINVEANHEASEAGYQLYRPWTHPSNRSQEPVGSTVINVSQSGSGQTDALVYGLLAIVAVVIVGGLGYLCVNRQKEVVV